MVSRQAGAQVTQAWVARYNNGITNGTNQAVKMALDSNGNIYVVGVSQNTNNDLGYVTIKYAPNGTQLWAARYDSTNYPTATPTSTAVDSSNNVIVTGSALTVKYDTNGNQLWAVPYSGASIAADAGGDAYVTGCQSGPGTVKIGPNGSNLWSTSFFSAYGPALLQAVVVDGAGNAYVAGSETNMCYPYGNSESCYCGMVLVKYDPLGNQLWDDVVPSDMVPIVQVEGMTLDSSTNIYVLANFYEGPYSTFSYT
jgi:Beta-propeller repeat